jgi:hypothetical protein
MRLLTRGAWLAIGPGFLFSCGTSPSGFSSPSPDAAMAGQNGMPNGGSPSSDGSASSGAAAAGNSVLTLGDAAAGPASVGDGAPDAFLGCASTTQQATRLPLDLYFILDASESMDDLVTATRSKWQAVSSAIESFVSDPNSAGLGFGLQYFPLTAKGFPGSCSSSAACGAQGICFLQICYDQSQFPCNTDRDCPGRFCGPVGACENDKNYLCIPTQPCTVDANGFSLGACQPLATSTCIGSDDCNEVDYATPAVGVATLPGVAAAVASSLAANSPRGSTPTQAALQGAIDGARAVASAHPDHTVVVVLATDGLPDEIPDGQGVCTAANTQQSADDMVAQVAATALAGTPSIKTFAIGVFTPDDAVSGTATLDEIATAGGTGQPFVVQTASAMDATEQQFVTALNAIRGASLPCAYEVPLPTSGTPNYFEVNVRYTAGSGTQTTEPYVESAGGCDPQLGGWYYNADPAEGGVPTTITVCPSTCSVIKADSAARVDIVVGCQTQTLPH